MSQTSERIALDRLLEPVSRCLTRESAERLVALRADAELQDRLDELAEKSTAGELTADERAEYEAYVRAIDFIGVLQAKARALLRSAQS